MTRLIVGNWKMNGSLVANRALLEALLAGAGQPGCDVVVCPPMPYLAQVQELLSGSSAIALGAQDVSWHEGGAFTGDVSASMLNDFGVRYVIVGHSERRLYQGESDLQVARKAQRVLAAGMTPIVCVGETLREREEGLTAFTVLRQLAAVIELNRSRLAELVVAYEPVWAIGTGLTATPAQAQQVHAALRAQLASAGVQVPRVRILYGGSMNTSNAAELLAEPDVDGGLIGGAALKAPDFLKILAAAS